MKGRKFRRGCVLHIYQRAADKGVIFYTAADRLVFYSTYAAVFARYGIPCYAASIMFTHIHLSCLPDSKEKLDSCLRDSSSCFARAYNHEHNRSGDLYDRPYGSSIKRSTKEIRSNLLYVFNNPVEKKLCSRAIDDRWSFLSYSKSTHPFSDPLSEETISKRLRRAIRLVDRHVLKKQPLKYSDVKSVLADLDQAETQQYIDYVITAYHLVDFSYGTRLFGSLKNMVDASDAVTGDEWDIREDFYGSSDIAYVQLCQYFEAKNFELSETNGQTERNVRTETNGQAVTNVRTGRKADATNIAGKPIGEAIFNRLFSMSDAEKMGLISDVLRHVNANGAQLSRFFHCDVPWK